MLWIPLGSTLIYYNLRVFVLCIWPKAFFFFLSKRPASANNSRQILLLAHCFLYDEANSCKVSILNSCIDCGIVKLQPREYIVILPTCLFGIGTGAECNNKINLIKTFLGSLFLYLAKCMLSICLSVYLSIQRQTQGVQHTAATLDSKCTSPTTVTP